MQQTQCETRDEVGVTGAAAVVSPNSSFKAGFQAILFCCLWSKSYIMIFISIYDATVTHTPSCLDHTPHFVF